MGINKSCPNENFNQLAPIIDGHCVQSTGERQLSPGFRFCDRTSNTSNIITNDIPIYNTRYPILRSLSKHIIGETGAHWDTGHIGTYAFLGVLLYIRSANP